MQETYSVIDSQTILVTVTTPVTDSAGNAVLDADQNPINSVTQTVLTLDQANANLATHQNNLAPATAQLDSDMRNVIAPDQANIDNINATIALDNARIAAFTQTATPATPQYSIQAPATLNTASPATNNPV